MREYNTRSGIMDANVSLELTFPKVYGAVLQHLQEAFPHLRYFYFERTLRCEAISMTYALIEFEVVDFRKEWEHYNEHFIQCFIQNFAVFNTVMNGYTPAKEIEPHIILNISA
ncbi:MAG TPA: hypothetical protein DCS20_02400 [Candidatus Yonathbacteria bacterium]|nr:hypothetical protein [Candidatus Yonathbacteria bacterium]